MEKNENAKEYTIDLVHIAKACLQKLWIIVIAGILAAVAGFLISSFAIAPEYSSSVLVFVNSKASAEGIVGALTSGDISTSQSIVKLNREIINSRTTLEKIIEKADVDYSYGTLAQMITADSVNGTQIMRITVTGHDPYEAARIANCTAEVLEERNEELHDSTMKIVDPAIPNTAKVSPNITTYTLIGLILGVLISVMVISVFAMLDDTVHDEEYILQNYDYPILAKIPYLTGESESHRNRFKNGPFADLGKK